MYFQTQDREQTEEQNENGSAKTEKTIVRP